MKTKLYANLLIYIYIISGALFITQPSYSATMSADAINEELSKANNYLKVNLIKEADRTISNLSYKELDEKQAKRYQDIQEQLFLAYKIDESLDEDESQDQAESQESQQETVEILETMRNPQSQLPATTPVMESVAVTPTRAPDKPVSNYQFNTNYKNIALLLPLSGSLAPIGNAIKDGVLAAYYQDPNPNKPQILVIDTENNPTKITDYYNQAVSQGSDLIIGPISKDSVSNLNQNTYGNVPILALNYLSNRQMTEGKPNFYQFGISAEDEAEQAAVKALSKNYKNSLLIIDNNDWGKRVSSTYKEKLEAIGGSVTKSLFINPRSNLNNIITAGLGFQQSFSRKKILEKVIGEKLEFEPRRSQDFDHIFLVTSSAAAKQIKPILKFYYADNLPVLSTSSIYDYKSNSTELNIKDLDGIEFCDIPWIIKPNQENTEYINKLKESNFGNFDSLIRLYALGVDSYNLAYSLNKLTATPNLEITSNTGNLYLDNYNKIHRHLPWAKILNGVPKST